MGGGLMQLVAYGAQDIYLTGNPQITFFKVVYRRHTNFSMEHIQQTFKGTPGANARVVATISRNGDLVHDCYLKFATSALSGINYNPGHSIINNIECEIGGQLIDRQYGHWMEAHAELVEDKFLSTTENYNMNSIHIDAVTPTDKMPGSAFQVAAGAGGTYFQNASGGTNGFFYVPLRFWFNRHVGLSLPLIALQYHEVNINVTFSSSTAYAIVSGSPELWANYIYLDTDERRRFAQVSHEYLIEQVQLQEFNKTTTSLTCKLNFNHPVKELVWVCDDPSNLWGSTLASSLGNNPLYTSSTTVQLKLNGHDRFATQNIDYFTRYQPMKYHPNFGFVSQTYDAIAVYSFALKPDEHQPSGTCNFSRIDNSHLHIEGIDESKPIYLFALSYNVLRIMNGMGGLAYSN